MSDLTPRTGRGLTERAIVLMVIGLVVPAVLLGFSGARTLWEYRGQLLAERERLANAIAGHVNTTLHWSLGDLWALQAGTIPPESARERLHESLLRSPFLEKVFLADASGTVTWHEPSHASLPPADAIARTVAEARQKSQAAFLTVSDGPAVNLMIVVPLHGSDAAVAECAGAVLDPARPALASVLGPGRAGERASVDVVDSAGRVLASSHAERIGRTAVLPSAAGTARAAVAFEGGEVVASVPLSLLPLSVVVRQEEAELLAPLHAAERRVLVAIPVLLLIVILFAWGAARSLTQPIAVLTAAAERIAAGELSGEIPPLGEDEVGRLGRSLETMRERLAEAFTRERQAQEELERRVAERTRDLTALARELRDHNERRAHLLAKFIRAQEDERKRIARELHDETCQTVAALSMATDTALAAPPDPDRGPLRDIKALAGRALSEIHRVIYDLRPSVLDDLGLASAVRWTADRQLKPLGITYRCEIEGLDERLPLEVETAVFRVVQEALTNVVRHAKAETVLVQMARENGRLSIEVEDDGQGFDPATVATPESSGRGLGLLGIRERVELLGGHVQIESSPGQGTRLALSVPLPGEA
ncbi:MAG TPA: ATP-binding protein [Thermoanaerobaculia bacterium]|nr:ATP-binding protein [Thermoanaerobaculia bacterium]